jgi:hypothetical protein
MSYGSVGISLCAAFIAAQAYRDGNGRPAPDAPGQGAMSSQPDQPSDSAGVR